MNLIKELGYDLPGLENILLFTGDLLPPAKGEKRCQSSVGPLLGTASRLIYENQEYLKKEFAEKEADK
jgi:hypothetical protein